MERNRAFNEEKIALITALVLMSPVALASPLTDYSFGKVSIDLMYRNTQNNLTSENLKENVFCTGDFDKKYNFEPPITVGLGNKFAFEYRNINAKSDYTAFSPSIAVNVWVRFKTQVNEFNILYQTSKNISIFAGYASTKGEYEEITPAFPYAASTKRDTWQMGLIGTVPIAEKIIGYARLGVDNKLTNCEVGVSYAFTKNLEFNIDYHHFKSKDLDFETHMGNMGKGRGDVTVKSLEFGVTCKI